MTKSTPIFKAKIKQGKCQFENADMFRRWCASLENKTVEVIVRKPLYQKSNKQNRYYRGVVVKLIAEECGYTTDRAHGELLELFFKVVPDDGGRAYIRSTALDNWDTVDWEEKMQEIRQWASEFLNLFIPLPNEVEMY